MILKFNYYDSRKTNTAIISSENKFSSASIGASFAPSGLTDISISANKGNGDSKEAVTAYSPALVSAKNDLTLTSSKDMDIKRAILILELNHRQQEGKRNRIPRSL